METILMLMLFYVGLELFEVQWQKADTMLKMLIRIHERYRKSIFYFLILHPTYYFAIWLILETNMAIPAVALLFIKTLDISTKLVMIQQVFHKKEVSMAMHDMLMEPIKPWMPYVGLFVYPPLAAWALL